MTILKPYQQQALEKIRTAKYGAFSEPFRGGKSLRSAMMIEHMINNGKRVYHLSPDPNKCGEIVEVKIPKNNG